jgi:rhodanese-related sulfurtransferase
MIGEQMSEVVLVEAHDWKVWSEEHDALIIDVREPFEWARGTLPGAELIGLGSLFSRVDELDPDRSILFICRTGNRSGVAAGLLAQRGFREVANLTGGLVALGLA